MYMVGGNFYKNNLRLSHLKIEAPAIKFEEVKKITPKC
jgi:hypothetical protein